MRRGWVWVWVGQGILLLLVALFVGDAVMANWAEFRDLEFDLDLKAGPIGLAVITIWLTYALLIEAWRRVILGWRQNLGFGAAARVWTLSNLGRYLPGKIWSVAGLAVLAQRQGVAGWAAAGSALAIQAIAMGTGAVVVAVAAPGATSPFVLVGLSLTAVAAMGFLIWRPLSRWTRRVFLSNTEFRALSLGTAAVAAAVTLGSWVSYGVAFWWLSRGMLGRETLSLGLAVGAFAAGYIVGLLALFAPGGIGVRELMFIGLLTPSLGSGNAVALSVGSRLLLTLTEVGAAAIAVIAGKGSRSEKG